MITKFSKIDTNNFDAVAQIYKAGIETGNATFETNIPSFEEWDEKHLPFGRIVIIKDGILVGWAALSKVSDRCVYEGVAEVSVYVSDHGKGLRTQLLQKLIEKPRSVHRTVKKMLKSSINLSTEEGTLKEIEIFKNYAYKEDDAKEGFFAFVEGRDPKWSIKNK